MTSRRAAWAFLVASSLTLSACATPARMHTPTELNSVAGKCGLAVGQVAQDEEEKRLLFVMQDLPTPPQRRCVIKWAKRNGLRPVFIEGVEFAE